jgi:hypothetical protein
MRHLLVNNEYEYDYDLTCNDNGEYVHSMYYSDTDNWSQNTRSTLALEIVDTGNGLRFGEKHLDYHEFNKLHLLFRLIDDNENKFQVFTKDSI